MHVFRTLTPLLGLAALVALACPQRAAAASLGYSFSQANTTNTAQNYTFTFNTPITALPAGAVITTTLSGTLSSTGTGVTITPFSQVFTADALVNTVDTGIGAGTAQTNAGAGPFNYPPAGNFFASGVSATTVNSIGVNLSFTLSAFSSASLNGMVTANAPAVTATPEPSSMAAFGFTALGVAGLMLKAKRRKAGGTPIA